MFRVFFKQRENLDLPQIADVEILSGTIKEDLTNKANSSIIVSYVPSNVKIGDIAVIYNAKGIFIYFGVISAIKDNKISLSQMYSLFGDNQLIGMPTTEATKGYYSSNPVSYISKLYLDSKIGGYISTDFSYDGNITFNSFVDSDVKDKYKAIQTRVIDEGTDYMPFPTEIKTQNLESFLYSQYNTYNRMSRVIYKNNVFTILLFNPVGDVTYDNVIYDYNKKVLFSTWENLTNQSITEESIDCNTCYIYGSDKTTLRGAYIVLNSGDIQELFNGQANPNRLGTGKTKYVFDDDNVVYDLARNQLPNLQYNHKITFDISFKDIYKFDDFNLGQPISFYKDNMLYDSLLTAWSYSIEENSDVIRNANFTLGKCRNNLTSYLNTKLDK